MLIHPTINPVALQLGPLAIHWYGLTYLAAFGLFYWLGTRRLQHLPFARLPQWERKDIEDILFLGVLGVVLGGASATACFTNRLTTPLTRSKSLPSGKAA